jgi:integrase
MKRRGRAEGSVYRRSDGRWVGAHHLGYAGGSRRRKVVYGRTQAEVVEKLAEVKRDFAAGLTVDAKRQSVGQFLVRWLDDVARPSVRPRTFISYEQIARVHLIPGLGGHQLSRLNPQIVQAFLNERSKSGLSPQTVSYLRAVLRNALGTAERWGLVVRNAAALAAPPKVERHSAAFLLPGDARRLLRALAGDRNEALFVVALATGLRQGELLGLRWQDVTLDSIGLGSVTVHQQMSRVHGKPVAAEPKTSRSRRSVTMAPFAAKALRSYRARQLEDRVLAGARWTDLDLVFATTIGTPLDPRRLARTLALATGRAGLPQMRFHDLRHSCASILAAQGVQPRVAMEILGHSDIRTTLSIYTHVLPGVQNEAATLMEDALGNA